MPEFRNKLLIHLLEEFQGAMAQDHLSNTSVVESNQALAVQGVAAPSECLDHPTTPIRMPDSVSLAQESERVVVVDFVIIVGVAESPRMRIWR